MLDYSFYRENGGSLSEEVFSAGISEAEAVIDALLRPTLPSELDGDRLTGYKKALCAELDHLTEIKGSPGMRIKSEALGDRRVTYESHSDTERAAPAAVDYLLSAGCIDLWV